MVASMKSGSVIVDLAAQTGGNCELTVADRVTTTDNGVKIIGYTDLPSRLPTQSSQLYGTNTVNLLKLLCKEKNGEIHIDFEDVVIRGVTTVRAGEITARRRFRFPPRRKRRSLPPPPPVDAKPTSPGANICCWRWLSCCSPARQTSRPPPSCRTLPCSRSPAWWVITWSGTSATHCIRR